MGGNHTEEADDIESRVRDLEEKERKAQAAITAITNQLGNLNCKMDMMLSKQDDKYEDCTAHKMQTALLDKAVQVIERERTEDKKAAEKALSEAKDDFKAKIKEVADEVVFFRRTAIGAAGTAVMALLAVIWKLLVG